jgi:sugar lactone lactonase YvrE
LNWFEDVQHLHETNRSPIVNSSVRLRMKDSTSWPEAADYDSASGNWYVSSVRHRNIVRVLPSGSEQFVLDTAGNNLGSIFGVRMDSKRSALWATMGSVPQMDNYKRADSSLAALLEIDVASGHLIRRWDLPAAKAHAPGDLTVAPNGDVYVTDSYEPVIYRLRSGSDTLDVITHPLFRSLQGAGATGDGRFLFVADYSHGILRVDLATREVTRVEDAPSSTSLGCDGIVLHQGSIVCVQNGVAPARIMRFELDQSGQRFTRATVLDRNFEIADEPTIGTIVGNDFVYVGTSQWSRYAADGSRIKSRQLTIPLLLALPLTW